MYRPLRWRFHLRISKCVLLWRWQHRQQRRLRLYMFHRSRLCLLRRHTNRSRHMHRWLRRWRSLWYRSRQVLRRRKWWYRRWMRWYLFNRVRIWVYSWIWNWVKCMYRSLRRRSCIWHGSWRSLRWRQLCRRLWSNMSDRRWLSMLRWWYLSTRHMFRLMRRWFHLWNNRWILLRWWKHKLKWWLQ